MRVIWLQVNQQIKNLCSFCEIDFESLKTGKEYKVDAKKISEWAIVCIYREIEKCKMFDKSL